MALPPRSPRRTLRPHPDLTQIKRQARELLRAFVAGEHGAVAEVNAHYRGARAGSLALHEAQLALARSYGFASWPRLKAYVDGVTVGRLCAAVRADDLGAVRSMLALRPELATLDSGENDEHQALHHAVLTRQPEAVRLLMRHGADPRKGIYPHRDATSALTLAADRGFSDIVATIREEEQRRSAPLGRGGEPSGLPGDGASHVAPVTGRGPERSAHRAIENEDAEWLRARHGSGELARQTDLLSHAVKSDRPEILALLLDLGFDPDESGRVGGLEEDVPSWGGPLRECGMSGKLAMAEMLLARGANPNTNVYAASSALSSAYTRGDAAMIALLERHGARLAPVFVGILGLTTEAARMLAADQPVMAGEGVAEPAPEVAPELLWGAIESPAPEIVRMALARIDWPRGDPRWYRMLENGLYLRPGSDRAGHLTCFRLTLERGGLDVRGSWNRAILHDIAASRGGLNAGDRVALASLVLDAGARFDARDDLLKSTPLGWACRWGRIELVELLLERGADPVEADAEPWAAPMAWAQKMKHGRIASELVRYGRGRL